jgi:hypothetical protein
MPDAVRVQILAAEHWSLLATRQLAWTEAFSRAGLFLTVLSASVVALALVAQTGSDRDFAVFAQVLLPVVLLLGVGTFAPDLEPYFVTPAITPFSTPPG